MISILWGRWMGWRREARVSERVECLCCSVANCVRRWSLTFAAPICSFRNFSRGVINTSSAFWIWCKKKKKKRKKYRQEGVRMKDANWLTHLWNDLKTTIKRKNITKTFQSSGSHSVSSQWSWSRNVPEKVYDTQDIIAPKIIQPKSNTDALSPNTSRV